MPMQTHANITGVNSVAEEMVHVASKHFARTDVATITDAGAATYTAAQVLGGIILRDCAGSGRTDVLPTAALLLASLRAEQIGMTIPVLIVNNSDAAETITIDAGSGGTMVQIAATRIIPQNTSRLVLIRITGVSTPAYDVYM